ncbi:hypothetical protein ACOME3_006963 [Neoechinorhynchus agilis]
MLSVDPQILTNYEIDFKSPTRIKNCALAVTICNAWMSKISSTKNIPLDRIDELTLRGIRSFNWIGRYQVVRQTSQRTWMLDGAHTVEASKYTSDWIQSELQNFNVKNSRIYLLLHFSHGRDPVAFLKNFNVSIFHQIVFVQQSGSTSEFGSSEINDGVNYLSTVINKNQSISIIKDIYQIDDILSAETPIDFNHELIAVTGSLYLVGDVLRLINQ